MSEHEPTCIGRVRHVLGATITVALDPDLAGVAPIYHGRLQPIGQIGSLVRIPQGLVDLIASVTLVGIAELSGPLEPAEIIQSDERWLQVQLLGEVNRGTAHFERGVGTYPGLDDPVHFCTPEDLRAVFPPPGDGHVCVGRLAAAEDVPVSLTADRFVVRHAAVVGSTGSGKTSAVASIIQRFIEGGWASANIVVIDPHGEYSSAFPENSSNLSVLGLGDDQLRVPYWALPANEILRILIGGSGGASLQNRFSELVTKARREFVAAATWLDLNPSAVTSDTPIPFEIRPVWYQLDRENRTTLENKGDPSSECILDAGDATTLASARFQPYQPGGAVPHKGPCYGAYGTGPDLLRLGLLDPELSFFLEPLGDAYDSDPLVNVVLDWLGHSNPVSVLDFSGVPANASEAAIGVILNLIFELAVRSGPDEVGIGRPHPVLVVLEEAHRYLGDGASKLTRRSANRIAREGRKYGVGLVLVSQRPTELPPTALAQCGTVVALRLSNSDDQGAIRHALPDTLAGLATILPSLRTHEAIVSGDAAILPARTLLEKPIPWPSAEDPSLSSWREDHLSPSVAAPLAAWRGTYDLEEEDLDA